MMKYLLTYIFIFYTFLLYSQDSVSISQGKKPIRDPWPGTVIIDNQTSFTLLKGNSEFIINHRFSSINEGAKDFYGFYGTSNIRMTLSYGLTNSLMIGFGTEKDKKVQEFYGKLSLLKQNRKGSIPFSLTIFGNACISGKEKAYWGVDYEFKDRLSFFSQLILSRKFGKYVSIQASGAYNHLNKVQSTKIKTETDTTITIQYYPLYQNSSYSFSASGRVTVWKVMGLVAEYNRSFYLNKLEPLQTAPKPSFAFGFEVNTPSHVFQLFASSYRAIVPQYNYVMNQYDMTKKSGIMLGFNIIVRY